LDRTDVVSECSTSDQIGKKVLIDGWQGAKPGYTLDKQTREVDVSNDRILQPSLNPWSIHRDYDIASFQLEGGDLRSLSGRPALRACPSQPPLGNVVAAQESNVIRLVRETGALERVAERHFDVICEQLAHDSNSASRSRTSS
jgi:hypothetical protein